MQIYFILGFILIIIIFIIYLYLLRRNMNKHVEDALFIRSKFTNPRMSRKFRYRPERNYKPLFRI